jgi:hypothetical protein
MIASVHKVYRYTAFGISIHSEIEIPEFTGLAGPADVIIRYGDVPIPPHDAGGSVRGVGIVGEGILLYWSAIGAFLIEHGRTVTVSPAQAADPGFVRLVLTGPALALLLAQRGLAVFHASVVWCPRTETSVAFSARSGCGKSTMAGAAYNAGYSMVSDDIMPVDLCNDVPVVAPGFAYAKLWADSAEALVANAGTLKPLAASYGKLSRPVTARFASAPARLAAVFVLEDGPDIVVSPLKGHSALSALLPHWYGAGFDGQLVEILGRQRHLRETTLLASRIWLYRLTRPRVLERLPDVVAAVENTVRSAMELKIEERSCLS